MPEPWPDPQKPAQEPYNVQGILTMAAGDEAGCHPNVNRSIYAQKVVLAKRGKCSFYTKAVNAQHGGAIAVLIGNNVTTSDELRMVRVGGEGGDDVDIVAAFVNGADYVFLRPLALNGTALAEINEVGEIAKWKQPITLMPPVVFITVWLMLLALFVCRRVVTRAIIRRSRISHMRHVPTVRYEPLGEDEEPGEDALVINSRCVICMEDFVEGEELKVLPCRHGFHPGCIDPWLADHSDRCPLCNRSMLRPEQGEEPDLEEYDAKGGRSEGSVEEELGDVGSGRDDDGGQGFDGARGGESRRGSRAALV